MFRHLFKPVVAGLMLVVTLQFVAAPPFASATTGTLGITANTTLTENHSGNIIIAANNITLDCANFSVIGPGASETAGIGILLDGITGVTVQNCNVTGFKFGMCLGTGSLCFSSGSSSNTFMSNSVNNNIIGFALSGASSNTFISNTANNIRHGFNLFSSNGNSFSGNVANGNHEFGFVIARSNGNILSNNTANNEPFGFAVFDSSGNTVDNNNANNDLTGAAFFVSGGGSNTVTNNTATNSNVGIQVSSSTGNTVANNRAGGNHFGFALTATGTSGNMFSNNTAIGNILPQGFGFFITSDPSGNTFKLNFACHNAGVDAFQAIPGSNTFLQNAFCTTSGIP